MAIFLPMHTATRLALPVIARVRALNPDAHLCAYGLYAPANRDLLSRSGVGTVLGGEFEADLVALAEALAAGTSLPHHAPPPTGQAPAVARLRFRVPDRSDLPAPDRYAAISWPDGTSRVVGYTESSRGCKHLCRHCPVVPVYNGRFRTVAPDIVLADISAQVARGARHITFGDPDFFNGIGHARHVVSGLARQHPDVSYDVTIKIEHLLRHAGDLALLRDTGCVLVTSAVESVDDNVLARLDKGHTSADFERAVDLMREAGLALAPTFVAFTPWTTRSGYLALLDTIDRLELVDHVAPIQWAIRLLIPSGSRLLELPDIVALVDGFDPAALAYPWRHADPQVDVLQKEIAALVGREASSRAQIFQAVRDLVLSTSEDPDQESLKSAPPRRARMTVPSMSEPWYCCAEPTEGQAALL